MAAANPLWGAPRIHGELLKLGIAISERTVSPLMPKRRQPPSQTWKAFLENHVNELVSIDFFTIATFLLPMQRSYVAGQTVSEEAPAAIFTLSRNAARGLRQGIFNN